jgi:hypothetical protein
MKNTQVEGEHVQVFKFFRLSIDKYALHYGFQVIDMNDVDVICVYS